MRTTFLLVAALTVFLAACDTAVDPVSIEPAASSESLTARGTNGMGAGMNTFVVEQVSSGTTQYIGFCDEAAGVARTSVPGTGTGSHVGRFQLEQTMCVDGGTGAVTEGAATVIAANGDEIHMTADGFIMPGSALPVFDLDYVVVGGTGRFANAEGEIEAHVVYTSPSTWVATSSGWLSYAASDRSGR